MTQRNWHPVQFAFSAPITFAFGVLHSNQSVNNVIAVIRRQSDRSWQWLVSAKIIPPPFNTGMENTSFDAMHAADKAIEEYKEEGKILPCPFCGNEDIRHEEYNGSNWLRCKHCYATGGFVLVNLADNIARETAIRRWNKRT